MSLEHRRAQEDAESGQVSRVLTASIPSEKVKSCGASTSRGKSSRLGRSPFGTYFVFCEKCAAKRDLRPSAVLIPLKQT